MKCSKEIPVYLRWIITVGISNIRLLPFLRKTVLFSPIARTLCSHSISVKLARSKNFCKRQNGWLHSNPGVWIKEVAKLASDSFVSTFTPSNINFGFQVIPHKKNAIKETRYPPFVTDRPGKFEFYLKGSLLIEQLFKLFNVVLISLSNSVSANDQETENTVDTSLSNTRTLSLISTISNHGIIVCNFSICERNH